MAPKLNQVIAIETGTKTRVYKDLSETHKALQKEELFTGHARTFRPRDDDPASPTGERIPDDNRKVTFKAKDILQETADKMTELFDVNAMREYSNCIAKADVTVAGKVLLKDVPVGYLLFLEKQLDDMHTFVKKLPTLSPTEHWEYNAQQDSFSTKPVESIKTKQVMRALVLYPATEQHPAQVKEVAEQVLHGTWTTTKYSSALQTSKVNEMLRRIQELQVATKFAREQANSVEVVQVKVGKAVFDHIFAPALTN